MDAYRKFANLFDCGSAVHPGRGHGAGARTFTTDMGYAALAIKRHHRDSGGSCAHPVATDGAATRHTVLG